MQWDQMCDYFSIFGHLIQWYLPNSIRNLPLFNLTDGQLGHVVRERVDVVGQQEGPEQEATDGSEGAHAVHEPDVDGGRVSLDVIVDVGRAQGEEGRATAAEKELGHHEDEDGQGRGLGRLLDAVVLPVVLVVVRGQRWWGQAWNKKNYPLALGSIF